MQPHRTPLAQRERALFIRLMATLMLIWAFGTAMLPAQSLEQWTTWGDRSMERGEHYGASRFYTGALDLDEGRMSLQWKMAEACRLSHQYDKAAAFYLRVHGKDQGRTYPDALRWLGEMQMCLGQYEEAEATWERVLKKERDKEGFVAWRARNAIAGCTIAREALAKPSDTVLGHPEAPLNTYDSEFGARIGPDSALYFTSLRGALNKDGEVVDTAGYRSAIYRAVQFGEGWSRPVPLTTLGNAGQAANPTWSLSGKWMFFTFCPDDGPCRIFSSPFNGVDLIPTPLDGLGDAMSTQPHVVEWDGREMLLFVSDRPGGEGGMDIWQARLENGRAVDVFPLGAPVNSPGNERSPWFHAATGTLWFSSDFHPGMGGYDLFRSSYSNDVFMEPVHGGVPWNSPANDLYFSLEPDGTTGWLTSNRIGSLAAKGETCCNDLFHFSAEPLAPPASEPGPQAKDSITGMFEALDRLTALGRRMPLTLYFHNDDPDPRSRATDTPQDYASAYRRYRELIPEYEARGDAASVRAFFRDEVDRGYLELAELVLAVRDALAAGASVELDVRGHASPLATNDYNINLSLRRIATLRNHLRLALGGELRPYLDGTAANGARLELRTMAFGEDRAQAGVSDALQDLPRSVYSVEAMRERRISVEAVRLGTLEQRSSSAILHQDLGPLKQEKERTVTFLVRNHGDRAMRLLDSQADCGCTTAELYAGEIAPGQEVPVQVVFSGRAPLGTLERTVTLRTNGTPERITLVIRGTVVP